MTTQIYESTMYLIAARSAVLPIAYCLLPIAYSLFPIPYSLFPSAKRYILSELTGVRNLESNNAATATAKMSNKNVTTTNAAP